MPRPALPAALFRQFSPKLRTVYNRYATCKLLKTHAFSLIDGVYTSKYRSLVGKRLKNSPKLKRARRFGREDLHDASANCSTALGIGATSVCSWNHRRAIQSRSKIEPANRLVRRAAQRTTKKIRQCAILDGTSTCLPLRRTAASTSTRFKAL
jgi:hypothetical protein